jgi:hypothetical protein
VNDQAAEARDADPEVEAVRAALAESDVKIPTGELDADGNPITRSAREVMAEADAEIADAKDHPARASRPRCRAS